MKGGYAMQMEATRPAAIGKAAPRPEFATILGRVRELRSEIESRALATAPMMPIFMSSSYGCIAEADDSLSG